MFAISMSEYDWCPVFAASNREYLCSRLVLAAVPASKRSGVLFQAVFRRPIPIISEQSRIFFTLFVDFICKFHLFLLPLQAERDNSKNT